MSSPYLTTKQAAELLLFTDTKRPERNFLRYAKRHAIPTFKRGKRVLVLRESLTSQLVEDARK